MYQRQYRHHQYRIYSKKKISINFCKELNNRMEVIHIQDIREEQK